MASSSHDDAAIALARGDALHALGLVSRLEDPRALLLRGVAYAQMGELDLAQRTLQRATLGGDDLTRARIDAASAEIALALGKAAPALQAARRAQEALASLGDARNAAMQRLVASRALVLLGDLDGAWRALEDVPPELTDVAALVRAEVAVRRLEASRALDALDEARRSKHALLVRAAESMRDELAAPVARLREGDVVREASLVELERAFAPDVLLIDTCRRLVRAGRATLLLSRRPIIFALLLALVEALPGSALRDDLARRVFDARKPNDSHRSRLRVEIGRLRKLLIGIAEPIAARDGYALSTSRRIVVVLPLTDGEDARIGALLGDGAAWSAQELAEHAAISKRTALRALASLVARGRAQRIAHGKETRYVASSGRTASRMLLLGLLPAR